jgi:hypothetical protein
MMEQIFYYVQDRDKGATGLGFEIRVQRNFSHEILIGPQTQL